MQIVKPEPLIIGGRAHYTLSSYDPVSIEVDVPYTSEQDIEYAIEGLIAQEDADPQDLQNPAWLKERFDVSNLDELHHLIYSQMQAMNTDMAEQQKAARCAAALAERLMQSVPAESVSRYILMISETFQHELAQTGNTIERFCIETGVTRADLDQMFYQEASAAAQNEAALDAWAENRKLTVADEELPRLLGLTPQDASTFINEARSHGQLEDIRRAALRTKALEIICAESNCTYVHETPEEAAQRVRELREQDAEMLANLARNEQAGSGDEHPHLKLV